jgi:type II secretion system protein N
MKKLLFAWAWGTWFSWCFVVFSIMTFPLEGLRPIVIAEAEKALGKGRQGPHGVEPTVAIGELAMSGLGVQATRVAVQLGNSEPEPGPQIDVDSIRIPLLPLVSFLTDRKTVDVDIELYDGDLSASVTVDDKQNVVGAELSVDEVDLGRAVFLGSKLGLPVEGKLSADVEIELGAQAEKDARGHVDLSVKGFGLGAGNLKVVPGGFELADGLRLGDLKGRMPIQQGQGTIESLRFDGSTDVEAEVTGTLSVKPRLQSSRLDVEGWFRPAAAFLEKNPKVKSAIELGEKLSLPGAPSLAKAKDEEGRYHFNARGPLHTLRPQLSRDSGKKASRSRAPRADAAAAAPPAGAPPPTTLPTREPRAAKERDKEKEPELAEPVPPDEVLPPE